MSEDSELEKSQITLDLRNTSLETLDLFMDESTDPFLFKDILFANGHRMRSLGKIPWPDYPGFLSGVDLGLSLMLSPHPSHPPIEMAAAGARVVTNRFEGKCLSSLTTAIRSVPPTPLALSEALHEAWAAGPASPAERRFDLSALGAPLAEAIDHLSGDIRAGQSPVRLRA